MNSVDQKINELMYLLESRSLVDARNELKEQTPHIVGHLAKLWIFQDYPRPDWYVHIAAAPRQAPKYRTKKLKIMDKDTISSTIYDYATSSDDALYTMIEDEVKKVSGYRAYHDYKNYDDRQTFKKILHRFLDKYAEVLCNKTKAGKDIDSEDIKQIVNDLRDEGTW